MQAIILAAGMGKRLKSLTAGNTKCMVKVNGVTLIERALRQLDDLGLDRIVIVVGYKGQQLIEYVSSLGVRTPLEFIDNPIYDKTNNIYSLSLAKEVLASGDTLLLESDLIFEDGILRSLVEDPRPTLALVDKYESWMDGTVVKLDKGDHISAFVPGKKFCFDDIPRYFKTVNVYKFSKAFSSNHYVPFLEAYSKALGDNEYYEQVLRVITLLDESELEVKRLDGQVWYEIDDLQDLDIAESLFAPTQEEKYEKVLSRHGGYWRYPRLVDCANLSNPCYPPQRLLDEMKASFDRLLTQRPSDIRVTSLLAAKTFSLECEHVVASDSVATLLKAVVDVTGGVLGCIGAPQEGAGELLGDESLAICDSFDWDATASALDSAFAGSDIKALLVSNPRAFWGAPLTAQQIEEVCEWCAGNGVTAIIDETLLDFCEEGVSLLTEKQLANHGGTVVVKGLSVCHGVSGARLAYAASANSELVEAVKACLPSHTVNAFGEFYLQIAEKYKGDYAAAMKAVRELRQQAVEIIGALPGVNVVNAQSNYLLLKLDANANEVSQRLLNEANILVRTFDEDCSLLGVTVCNMEYSRTLAAALERAAE